MTETPLSYFPSELPLQLTDLLTSAHALDVRRCGRGGSIVHRVHLTVDGKPVGHDQRTDRADEDLAAECFGEAEKHAEAHHRGSGKYRITATYAKPPRGFSAKPQSIEFQVGDVEETTEATHRSDLLAEMRSDRKAFSIEHLNLIRETTKLATVVATMVGSLIEANARITDRERALARENQETTIAREEAERQGRRERMVMKMFAPLLQQLLAGKAALAPATASTTPTSDASKHPPMVAAARALASSLDSVQLDAAERHLGHGARERFVELRDVTEEADVMLFGVWLFEKETEDTMALYATFTEAQQSAALELNALITNASQAAARSDADEGRESDD